MSLQENDIITLRGVGLRRDGRTILENVDLSVAKGDFVAITGPNGGGKTTLLRIMLGLVKPTSGTVAVGPGVTIGYLPQKNMIDSRFPITVEEVVASGLLGDKVTREQTAALTRETLGLIGLEAHASKSIGTLSGGQL